MKNVTLASNRGGAFPAAWLRDCRGSSAVEFALLLPILLVLTFAIIDFGRLVFEFAMAEKATQRGVRVAIVSDPVATDLRNFDCMNSTVAPGMACNTAGADTLPNVSCSKSGGSGSCSNWTDGFDDAAFTAIVTQMQGLSPRIQPENVVIEYRNTSLGFAGQSGVGAPPVVLVTVSLRNMTFNFLAVDRLINMFASMFGGGMAGSLTMPGFAASLTSEDLRTVGS